MSNIKNCKLISFQICFVFILPNTDKYHHLNDMQYMVSGSWGIEAYDSTIGNLIIHFMRKFIQLIEKSV